MIKINNISKSFGDLKVLKEISLKIEEGKIFGLVGRSGVGKSTLLRCINGLEDYCGGSLKVDNTEIGELKGEALRNFRKDIGMIFQQFSLVSRLSVFKNIAMPLECWKYDKKYTKERVEELLDLVGIPKKIHTQARDLSGGQKQRVAIARALALKPKILLCDEATSALDPKSTDSVIDLLLEINKLLGITIVVVTHEMQVVQKLCDSMAIMEDGKIKEIGTVKELFSDPPPALQNLLGDRAYFKLPEKGKNIEISYVPDEKNEDIISRLAREINIDFSVIEKKEKILKEVLIDTLILNLKTEDIGQVETFFETNDISWKLLGNQEVN